MMGISRIAPIVMVVVIIGSCSSKKFFFEKGLDNVLVCDTLFSKKLRKDWQTLSLYQEAPGEAFIVDNKKYYEYRISTTQKFVPVMLSSQDEKIYLVSKHLLLKNDYRDEIILDLNSKIGDTWDVHQGGLLGNSSYTLDSIDSSNNLYYFSMHSIIEVDDAISAYRMILSPREGIREIGLNISNDSIVCRCK